MKLVSISLLTIFCALLGAQLACAAGWQVHGLCSSTQIDHDHEMDSHWDPCGQSFSFPTQKKLIDDTFDFLPLEDDPQFRLATSHQPQPLDLDVPTGASSPHPTGIFPLLN